MLGNKRIVWRRLGNIAMLSVVHPVLLFVVLSCDSPPWSRFAVANSTSSDVVVRFYTKYPTMHYPYLYSPEEWKAKEHFASGTPSDRFRINEEEGWIEAVVLPGAAVEIDRARYPDVEQNVESNFLINRLQIQGSVGSRSWTGQRQVFNQFQKEWIGAYRYITGTSPLYVYYYK